ncbi:VanZ family protein [candidate division KSB1 bacterium]|nr:VanZ family protein [candidate division KSB1 bacterium]
MKNFKNFFWFQFPAIAWAIAIFVQSSLSDLPAPDLGFDMQDKVSHAAEYAILGFFLRRALVFQKNNFIHEHANQLTFSIGSLYAVSDEIHQSFVPGRNADIGDVIADVTGIFLVVAFYFCLKQIKKWRRRKSFLGADHPV